MIRRIQLLMISLITLAMIGGCVDTGGQASVSGGKAAATGVTGSGDAILLVNGENVYPADIVSSPLMRQALRQYVYFHKLRQIAQQEGVTADPAKVDEHVELLKQRLVERGESWEKYLTELAMTEDEYRSNIIDSLLQDGIIEKRVDVTPEKMQKIWDEQRDKVIGEYMMTNHLPESEEALVTFEDCHDLLFEKVMRIEGVPILGNLQAEMTLDATLDILCIKDPELVSRYKFLILESDQEQTLARMPEGGYSMPGANKAEDGTEAAGTDSAAGSDQSGGTGVDAGV